MLVWGLFYKLIQQVLPNTLGMKVQERQKNYSIPKRMSYIRLTYIAITAFLENMDFGEEEVPLSITSCDGGEGSGVKDKW